MSIVPALRYCGTIDFSCLGYNASVWWLGSSNCLIELSLPLVFDDHPLLPRLSVISAVVPPALNESSLSLLKIVAEHIAVLDRPFFPAGYDSSHLFPRFSALDNIVPDSVADSPPGSRVTVESLMLEVRGL